MMIMQNANVGARVIMVSGCCPILVNVIYQSRIWSSKVRGQSQQIFDYALEIHTIILTKFSD